MSSIHRQRCSKCHRRRKKSHEKKIEDGRSDCPTSETDAENAIFDKAWGKALKRKRG
jgi:hypothetical protein